MAVLFSEREEIPMKPSIPAALDTALPSQVAEVLITTPAGLAEMRYRRKGPKYIKRGSRVLYRWSDVREYLDANTVAGQK